MDEKTTRRDPGIAQSTVSPEPLSSPMDGYGGCVYCADDQDDFETERVGCCREDGESDA